MASLLQPSPAQVKQLINDALSSLDTELRDINHKIHSNPELGYEEHKAHDNIVALLQTQPDIRVTPHTYGLDTSFEAEYSNTTGADSNSRLVVFSVEYDALPGIGHACGHNIIATGSLAAFFATAALLRANPHIPGRVRALGTPAEEGGGGKIKLIDAGAFRGVDACLMTHPMAGTMYNTKSDAAHGIPYGTSVASAKFKATFSGRTAHAAAAPQDGINALDAAVLAYNGISMLRQQIMPYERIHGIILEGGEKPNVIPSRARMDYNVRSRTLVETKKLQARVEKCFEGAAIATGCGIEFEETNNYAEVVPNRALCRVYSDFMADIGLPQMPFDSDDEGAIPHPGSYSTDQGNVTQVCPGFHPVYRIPADGGASNHTKEFTAAAITDEAYDLTLATAKGMAATAWRVLADDQFAEGMRAEFERYKAKSA
ncbi:aminobenzoyl-glutamate utilization protein B [Microdochium nivale]|nr:aminobenzoyl-glutamate utilization protein B [Microdochium nivale]